ncbi:hypothetical protein AAIA72_02115 [Hahella sp. SMD15-11]|uniref:Lipoprotein n=1 Tax=Thermohahella caldifontis TaxID=3142973 RepID=A0AB39UX66_9GAMM
MHAGRVILLASACATLVACGWNTRLDDSEYRPVGQNTPGQTRIVDARPVTPAGPKAEPYQADGVSLQDNSAVTLRYGFTETIHKVIQTAEIHCVPQKLNSDVNASALTSCFYQFPKFCGAPAFTVIRTPLKTALVYHDTQERRNVVDVVSDRHLSQPGLWDVSDRLSVAVKDPAAAWVEAFGENNWRGWEVSLTDADRTYYGTRYARAINQTLSCY